MNKHDRYLPKTSSTAQKQKKNNNTKGEKKIVFKL